MTMRATILLGVIANKGRCQCCDLPAWSCGTAKMRELREQDPDFARWLETPEGVRQ